MKALQKFTDKILLDRAQAGDTEAFGVLYKRYVGKIYRFIYFRIRERELVDDLTNEVFLKLWQQLTEGTKIQTLQAYLYKITRNIIIDHYRTRREQIDIDEAPHLIDENQDLQENILVDDEIKNLLKHIHSLRDDYREILILRYVEDLSITEISAVLEKSHGAVKVAIHRATKKLKQVYNDQN